MVMNSSIVRKASLIAGIPQSKTHLEVPKVSQQLRSRKTSWTLIDGEVDEIHWSTSDGCRKWAKRLLTIGNILAIIISILPSFVCIVFLPYKVDSCLQYCDSISS